MARIESFEGLNVWKEARKLNKEIYIHIISNTTFRDFPLQDQINRSAGSIADNIAEGFERQGNKEFRQFLGIARGSCGEVKSQLYRALDREYLSDEVFRKLIEQSKNISKMLNGFIKYLNSSSYKGTKFLNEPEVIYGIDSEEEPT